MSPTPNRPVVDTAASDSPLDLRLRRVSREFGNTRDRTDVRPKRPVNISGSPRALSWSVPDGSRMAGPITAHVACRCNSFSSSRPTPARRRQSGLSTSRNGADEAAVPMLTPAANPAFESFLTTRTFGWPSAARSLRSVEALSTTTASHARPSRPPERDARVDASADPLL